MLVIIQCVVCILVFSPSPLLDAGKTICFLLLHLIPREIKDTVTSLMFFFLEWHHYVIQPKTYGSWGHAGIVLETWSNRVKVAVVSFPLISLDSDQTPLNIISHWHPLSLLRLRPQLHQPPNTSTHIQTWTQPTWGDKLVCSPADSRSLLQSCSSGVVMTLPQQQ